MAAGMSESDFLRRVVNLTGQYGEPLLPSTHLQDYEDYAGTMRRYGKGELHIETAEDGSIIERSIGNIVVKETVLATHRRNTRLILLGEAAMFMPDETNDDGVEVGHHLGAVEITMSSLATAGDVRGDLLSLSYDIFSSGNVSLDRAFAFPPDEEAPQVTSSEMDAIKDVLDELELQTLVDEKDGSEFVYQNYGIIDSTHLYALARFLTAELSPSGQAEL